MKKTNILMFCLCFVMTRASGQLKHYITINTALYANFFNTEKEAIDLTQFLSKSSPMFRFSYKIEKAKHGLEVYFTHYDKDYHEIKYGIVENNQIINISQFIWGLNYHYKIYQCKYLEINPFAGLSRVSMGFTKFIAWTPNDTWHEAILSGHEQSTLGMQIGFNVLVPIWNGIYTNANLRYNAVPWSKDSETRNSMFVELGLGYKIQRKTQ